MALIFLALPALLAITASGAESKKSAAVDPAATDPALAPATEKAPRPVKAPKAPKAPKVAKVAKEPKAPRQETTLAQREERREQLQQHRDERSAAERQGRVVRQAERQERINKRNEGNTETPPSEAPAGSGGPSSSPATSSASGSSDSSADSNATPRASGTTGLSGGGESGESPQQRAAERQGESGSGQTDGSAAAGASGAGAAATEAADPVPNPASSEVKTERTGSTIVERVVREIPSEYRAAIAVLGALVLLLSGVSVRERRRSVKTERDMLIDGLTGVGSRTALQRQLDSEWKRSRRHDRPLGLVLLDLDDLKEINDQFGHAAGDELLRSAGNSISERVRESDSVARLGGDEFVVVCPETSELGLAQLANALQDDFRTLGVGVSVGFAERGPSDEGPADLMARADAAMYAHKRAGAAVR